MENCLVKGEGKGGDRRANTNRSKHSETEQRRRSKINERFQMLRQLIPENDQKKDKASFLTEVIEYIQFLQGLIHSYEGTYQGWNPEASKLIPWKNNCGPAESFIDQSQLVRNGIAQEGNIVFTPAVLTNAQNAIDPDFSGDAAYKATDHGESTQSLPLNIPLPANLFEGVTTQPPEGTFPDAVRLASLSHSPPWHARPCTTDCAPSYTTDASVEPTTENGGAMANACSQGLLNTLTHVLESSGVDLSRTSISVQLDIGKRTNSGMTSMTFGTKDHEILSPSDQDMPHCGVGSSGEESDQARKRLRVEHS